MALTDIISRSDSSASSTSSYFASSKQFEGLKQDATVLLYLLSLSVLPLISIIAIIALLFTSYFWVSCAYAIFYIVTLRNPDSGGWPSRPLFPYCPLELLEAYFPADVRFEDADQFESDANYMLCVPCSTASQS